MDTIGRYQLIEEIGRGGMGAVFRAHDTLLGRKVALKLLPRHLLRAGTFYERFRREAQIIAKLEHQHIVPIYDFGVHDEQPFLVMRLLTGGTLHEHIHKQRIVPSQLWPILLQVASALDMAHKQQIVHRDIKPTNILFDNNGNAFVSDFGIAKVLSSETRLTASALIGSPAYMSPEQFASDAIDGRADQYSLAIVIYELLAGQLPFIGDTARVMFQHLNKQPPAIHRLIKVRPQAMAILHRALQKNPNSRFETVTEFVQAIAAITHLPPTPLRLTPPKIEPDKLLSLTELLTLEQSKPVFLPEGEKPFWQRPFFRVITILVVLIVIIAAMIIFSSQKETADLSTTTTELITDPTMVRLATENTPEMATEAATSDPLSALVPTTTPTLMQALTAAPVLSLQARIILSPANVRTGPGTQYPIAGILQQGDIVTVVARNFNSSWYLIELNEAETVWLAASAAEKVTPFNDGDIATAVTIPAPPLISAPPILPTNTPRQQPTNTPQPISTNAPLPAPTSPPTDTPLPPLTPIIATETKLPPIALTLIATMLPQPTSPP